MIEPRGASVEEKLRTTKLNGIGKVLETTASSWNRMFIDRLPVTGKTLDGLERDYQEQFKLIPSDVSPDELELLMKKYALAMKLREGKRTASQREYYFKEIGGPQELTPIISEFRRNYLNLIDIKSHGIIVGTSLPPVIYLKSHWDLGPGFPTISDEFARHLSDPEIQKGLVDNTGYVMLNPIIKVHSRWIAKVIADKEAEKVEKDDEANNQYIDYEGNDTEGSWLDDLHAREDESL